MKNPHADLKKRDAVLAGDKPPTPRELAEALGQKSRRARIQVAAAEDRTWATPDGEVIVFASTHEMDEYQKFYGLQKCGLITGLRRQIKYPLHAVTPHGHKVQITSYRADIVLEDREGRTCVFDPKPQGGHRTERWKLIRPWFEAEYGLHVVEL